MQKISAKQLYPGLVLGDFTLIGRVRMGSTGSYNVRRKWRVRCVCGRTLSIPQHYLLREPFPKRNCGECKRSVKAKNQREYRIWNAIRMRCYKPDHIAYKYYGARGIGMHPDWYPLDGGFEKFFEHIGKAPTKHHSVDRIDVNGNYEPGNVRWATATEQARNTRVYLARKAKFKHPIGEK